MNEHVPTTEEIRECYAGHDFDSESWGVKFDTWLEEVKREAREQALESFRQGTLNIVPMRRPLP